MAVTLDQPAEGTHLAFLDGAGGQLVHEGLVREELLGVIQLGEHVGQIDHAGGRSEGGHVAAGNDGNIQFAVFALLHVGLFVAERAAVELLAGNGAVGSFLKDFSKLVECVHMGAALGTGSGDLERLLLVLDRMAGADSAEKSQSR